MKSMMSAKVSVCKIQFCLVIFMLCKAIAVNRTLASQSAIERIYDFTKTSGPGCPYTASWLAHINLYKKLPWYLDVTKMEAASFTIFDRSKLKFQVSDPDAYFVHHMSMYEHLNHKKHGFSVAQNKTIALSQAAFAGECDGLQMTKSKEYMALIPFYGGRPPGTTSELKVKSIGEGNSLVDAGTKALQTLATICSCLRYFGHATVGVARLEDRLLINDMLTRLSSSARHRVNVVQMQMARPSNLPFHLLAWGQRYVRERNCRRFFKPVNDTAANGRVGNISGGFSDARIPGQRRLVGRKSVAVAEEEQENDDRIDSSLIPGEEDGAAWDGGVFEICRPDAVARSHGGPLNVTYVRRNSHSSGSSHAIFSDGKGTGGLASNASSSSSGSAKTTRGHYQTPIRFVYFTESDQIVSFDTMETLRALSAASNDSCFFTGRRREKAADSDPTDYMGSLDNWRNCGAPGYSLHWPRDVHVKFD